MIRLSAAIALLTMSITHAEAADLSYNQSIDGVNIAVTGEIARGDAGNLSIMLTKAKVAPGPVVINFDSPGGSLLEGLQMADLIHQNHAATYVGPDAECVSACAIIFMGGAKRVGAVTVPDRMLHPSGRLGFHAPVLPVGLFRADGNSPVPVAGVIERQLLAAALQFSELTVRHGWQPSLVRAALDARGKDEVVYLTTIGDAGRWYIRLDAEKDLRLFGSRAAQVLCSNLHSWTTDGELNSSATVSPSAMYRTFLPDAPASTMTEAQRLEDWVNSFSTDGAVYAVEDDGRRQLGTEGMTDRCTIETEADGTVLDIQIYNDDLSPINATYENDYNAARPLQLGVFEWHLLAPHVRLSDMNAYEGDKAFVVERKFDHNSSTMLLTTIRTPTDELLVTIQYLWPKKSISNIVTSGDVLFEGRFAKGRVAGVARTFRKGCAPALYQVSGSWTGGDFELTGAAPRRAKGSCNVIGHDGKSSNSKLVFAELDD